MWAAVPQQFRCFLTSYLAELPWPLQTQSKKKAQGRGEQLSAGVVCEQVCSTAEWTSCVCKGGKGSAQLRWHGHEPHSRGLSALLCILCLWWLPMQLGQAFIIWVHFPRLISCFNVVSRALRDVQNLIGTGGFFISKETIYLCRHASNSMGAGFYFL